MRELLNSAVEEYRIRGMAGVIRGGVQRARETLEEQTIDRTDFEIPYYVKKEERLRRKHMHKLSEKGVGPCIDEVSLERKKSSETVFILGSGSSINEISDAQWKQIDQHDSIGLNRWPIHDFVPTYYVFEQHLSPDEPKFNKMFWKMIEAVGEDYRDIPVILKDASAVTDRLEPADLPKWLREKLIISCDSAFPQLVAWSSEEKQHRRLLRYLDYKCYFDRQSYRLLYRKRSSISYLIHLAVVLGYDTIVLCGVDLTDSKYFFESEQYQDSDIPIPWRSFRRERDGTDETHKVNDPELGRLTLENIVYMLDDLILTPRDIDLYVESDRSALHPELPQYEYT